VSPAGPTRPRETSNAGTRRSRPGRVALARRAVHGVGVDLGDDVAPHELDHLQGVLDGGGPDRHHELVGSRRLPATALLDGLVGVAHDDRPHGRHGLHRARVVVGEDLGPEGHALGMGEGVVVAEDLALEVVRLGRHRRAHRGVVVLFHEGGRGHADVVVDEGADGLGLADGALVAAGHALHVHEVAHREAEHAETLAGGHLVAARVARRVPHGRVRLLPGLGEDHARRQRPVLPLVALVGVLHPHLGELGDHVLPDLPGARQVLHAGQEGQDLVAAGPPPRAELEAALRHVVQHGHALRHLGRVVELGQRVEDGGHDVDALRGVGQVAGDHVARREVRVLVEEVVLGDEHVLEPGAVGGLDGPQLLHDDGVLGVGVPRPAEDRDVVLDEDAEFHGALLGVSGRRRAGRARRCRSGALRGR